MDATESDLPAEDPPQIESQVNDEPVTPPAVPDPVVPSEAHVSPENVGWMYRHALAVRVGHWVNVICLPVMILSGFQIFNAHSALYWGERSDRDRPIFAMKAVREKNGDLKGITTLFGHSFNTTGVFGASRDASGEMQRRGFPTWATLPSNRWLAMGRRWHFFFAWIFVLNGSFFVAYTVVSRHLVRDLFPRARDLREIPRSLVQHLTFRHSRGEESAHYNILQKLAYTGVVFVLAPLIVLTGLTMSPRMDAAAPFLLDLFGGRQSARTVHFAACLGFIGYTGVHLAMVAITGLSNNIRSMLTGWFRIAESRRNLE